MIVSIIGNLKATALIPHGIEERFYQPPKKQRKLSEVSYDEPLELLYVSILMPYKHQYEVAKSVAHLREKGYPLKMTFIGGSWGEYGSNFKELIRHLDPSDQFLFWSGALPFEKVHELYQQSDIFIFGSSCENLPNIMIEAMASGLPIASSNRGPMPEVLGNAGVYFDPENIDSIEQAVLRLVEDFSLRCQLSKMSMDRARSYSWKLCANQTLDYIAGIALSKMS